MKRNIFSVILSCLLLLAAGCAHTDEPVTAPLENGSRMVRFHAKVDQRWNASDTAAETRAPSSTVENVVKDIWVFQFDGTDKNTNTLVSPPKYLTGMDVASAESVALRDGGNDDQRVVLLANYDDPDIRWGFTAGQTTFAELEQRMLEIKEEAELYPNGAILMYADKVMKVNSSTPQDIQFDMAYPMARLNLALSCTDPNIIIEDIRVGNVPVKMDMFGNPGATAIYPEQGMVKHILYDAVDGSAVNSVAQTFVWYVPQNLQGVAAQSTRPETKNIYAPQGATYITVRARDASTDSPVLYTFYPGEDTTGDFNIRSSHSYNMTVTITGRNSATVDSRIDDREIVSYAGDASNTYILNPPASGKTTYRIYPTQVDLFWGQRYENVPENMLYDDEPWTVELVWMDEPGMVGTGGGAITLSKDTGAGVNDYFDVTVPAGAAQGNFTVRIYRTNDAMETTLWSWLFWLTDYDPDISRLATAKGTYIYPVSNGNVYRLTKSAPDNDAPDLWADGGIYAGSFLMDRHIGERESYHNYDNSRKGGLHFMWGRKDPWPMSSATDMTGSPVAFTHDRYNEYSPADYVTDPLLFAYYNVSSMSGKNWGDKYLQLTTVEESAAADSKSIFDPCPPGWRVPNAHTFADLRNGTTIKADGRGLNYTKDAIRAYRYWPYVEVNGVYPVGGNMTFVSAFSRNTTGSVVATGGMWTNFSDPVYSNGLHRRSEIDVSGSCGPDGTNIYTVSATSVRCVSMHRR